MRKGILFFYDYEMGEGWGGSSHEKKNSNETEIPEAEVQTLQ